MVSIVIPLYNKEKYIIDALQSVINQSYNQFEIIIVNDGSCDNSLQMINSIDDARIRIINIPNSGVSFARNKGISEAKFEWIAFLDADDWWDKTFLSELIEATKIYPNEVVFATGRSRVFLNAVERYQNSFLPICGKTELIDYFKVITKFLPPINSSNVMIKKSALESAGLFKDGQKKHEDHDLWLRLCVANNLVFVNKNLSFYRKEIENSGSQGVYNAEDFMRYMQTLLTVKQKLDKSRLFFFKKYYNRFVILTFIKYEGNYTKDERLKVFKTGKSICDNGYLLILKIVYFLPSGMVYKILKRIKR